MNYYNDGTVPAPPALATTGDTVLLSDKALSRTSVFAETLPKAAQQQILTEEAVAVAGDGDDDDLGPLNLSRTSRLAGVPPFVDRDAASVASSARSYRGKREADDDELPPGSTYPWGGEAEKKLTPQAVHIGHPRDRDVLEELFAVTGGRSWNSTLERFEGWRHRLGWDEYNSEDGGPTAWMNTYVCVWEGIKLNNDGRVVAIDLRANGLCGPLPRGPSKATDLFALKHLETLSLLENDLTGGIPDDIGVSEARTILRLSNNPRLGGTIPERWDAPRLEHLHLYGCGLTGTVPTSLFSNATGLRTLKLSDNPSLGGRIPAQISLLTRLLSLDCSKCSFTGHLPPVGRIRSLTRLSLCHNKFSGAIAYLEINKATRLEALYINDNSLLNGRLAARDLTSLRRMTAVDASGCDLTGRLPAEAFPFMPNMRSLQLGRNSFQGGGVPDSIGEMFGLRHLSLRDAKLSGPVPPGLGNLLNISTIDLSGNRLTGEIPAELGTLGRSLRKLDLSRNVLEGEIPSTLQSLSLLVLLNLAHNRGLTHVKEAQRELDLALPKASCYVAWRDYEVNAEKKRVLLERRAAAARGGQEREEAAKAEIEAQMRRTAAIGEAAAAEEEALRRRAEAM